MEIDENLKNKSGIYRLICNFKSYVGSSKNIYLRLKNHFAKLKSNNHRNKHLQNAFNKYGEEFFTYEILCFCEIENLFEIENKFIKEFDSFNNGFNQSCNARSPEGYKHSEESRLKISIAKKGVKQKEEHVINRSKKLKGKKHSKETIEKLSASKIGDKNPMYGTKQDSEFIKKRMKNCLEKPRWNTGLSKDSDERILKMANNRKGTPASNKIAHQLLDLETNEIWKSDSLKELSLICPLSCTTLSKLKNNNCGIKITKKYKITW